MTRAVISTIGTLQSDWTGRMLLMSDGSMHVIVSSTDTALTIRPASWLERLRCRWMQAWRWVVRMTLRAWDSAVDSWRAA